MTETELLGKISTAGWAVLEGRNIDTRPDVTLKDVLCYKPDGGVAKQARFSYFVKSDGAAYWKDNDPFFVPPVVVTFSEKVRTKIASLITAGTIKAGYIEKMDDQNEVALVVAVKVDNTLSMYHVYKSGVDLAVTLVTGTYPV